MDRFDLSIATCYRRCATILPNNTTESKRTNIMPMQVSHTPTHPSHTTCIHRRNRWHKARRRGAHPSLRRYGTIGTTGSRTEDARAQILPPPTDALVQRGTDLYNHVEVWRHCRWGDLCRGRRSRGHCGVRERTVQGLAEGTARCHQG